MRTIITILKAIISVSDKRVVIINNNIISSIEVNQKNYNKFDPVFSQIKLKYFAIS